MSLLKSKPKKEFNVLEGPLLGKIITFTIPIVLTNVLQWAYNAADSIVVGQFCGKNALAAVTGTATLVSLMIALMTGLSLGASVLMAHAVGENNPDKIKKTQGTSFTVAVGIGIITMLLGLFFAPTFLRWIGSPEDIIDQSALYLRIYFAGAPFNAVYLFGAGMMRSVGDSKRPLMYALISGAVNVVLNLLLVIVFNLGVIGVGVATVASMVVSCILVLRTFRKGDGPLKFTLRDFSFQPRIFGKLLSIGLPAALQSATFHLSNTIVQSSVNSLGSTVVAANGAAASIDNLVLQITMAFYHSAATFVGQCYGAKRIDRLGKCVRLGTVLVVVVASVVGGVFYLFGRLLLSLYVHEPDPQIMKEIIDYGMVRLFFIALLYGPCAFQDNLAFCLKSMDRSFISMMASIISICGSRITWVLFVFPHFSSLPTIEALPWLYVVYLISWILASIAQITIYFVTKGQLKKKWAMEKENVTV